MRVLLATCRTLPEPDPDQTLLLEALARTGQCPDLGAWDDADVDWAAADLVVLRSTWNYYRAPEAFLDWATRVDAVTRLRNPLAAVVWNHHKQYLLELEAREVAVAPTALLRRGAPDTLEGVMRNRDWDEVVVKPAISASSYRTARFDRASLARGEDHLRGLLGERDVLVQRYLSSVETYGERALVWIDGAFTHAVRKTPRLMEEDERVSEALPIAPDERALGERAMAALPVGDLLYARVDTARDDEGRPRIMELELIEPSLFLAQCPEALARLTRAIAGRLPR